YVEVSRNAAMDDASVVAVGVHYSDTLLRPVLRRHGKLGVVLLDLAVEVHRTELRSAHRAELRALEVVVREGLIVQRAGRLGIQGEGELAVPVEGITRPRQLVVPVASARAVARDVGGVGSDLVSDDPRLDILGVRQAQVLL